MSYRADKQVLTAHTDGRTDGRTHRQTDAGNDNTRRPKLASGKKKHSSWILYRWRLSFCWGYLNPFSCIKGFVFWLDPSHKSQNASMPYPTMHHFVTEMCTHVHISVTKWCIVGYLFDALWDLWDGCIQWLGNNELNRIKNDTQKLNSSRSGFSFQWAKDLWWLWSFTSRDLDLSQAMTLTFHQQWSQAAIHHGLGRNISCWIREDWSQGTRNMIWQSVPQFHICYPCDLDND